MAIAYEPFRRSELEPLVGLLTRNDWPFHSGGRPDRAATERRAHAGFYDGETVQTYWIVEAGRRLGLIRMHDLDDATPMFDLRIVESERGRGVGTRAVTWLTHHLFVGLPHVSRVEAVTRHDNLAMRRVLGRCGYVKEAHYRDAWPGEADHPYDAVGYAILRRDWASGTTTPVRWDDESPRPLSP